MKKIFIALFLSTSSLFAHWEHIHQHIVYEAYQLLKVYHGINIPAFENNMGSFGSTSYFWTTGQILKGAYLEDHHDPATNTGGWFNGWTPSSTHF